MIEFLSNKVNTISCEKTVSLLGKTPVTEIGHICQNDSDKSKVCIFKDEKKKYLKRPILKLAGKMCETWLLKSGKEAVPRMQTLSLFPSAMVSFHIFLTETGIYTNILHLWKELGKTQLEPRASISCWPQSA